MRGEIPSPLNISFNRTILECKLVSENYRLKNMHPFNRTILECKFCRQCNHSTSYLAFNRTILECKFLS